MWAIFDRLNKCCFDYIGSEEGINMMRTNLRSYWRWKKMNLEFLYIELDKSGSRHCWNEVSIWQILVRECESSSEDLWLVELDIVFKDSTMINVKIIRNFSLNYLTRRFNDFSTYSDSPSIFLISIKPIVIFKLKLDKLQFPISILCWPYFAIFSFHFNIVLNHRAVKNNNGNWQQSFHTFFNFFKHSQKKLHATVLKNITEKRMEVNFLCRLWVATWNFFYFFFKRWMKPRNNARWLMW